MIFKSKMSIRRKILTSVLTVVILIFILTVGYISYNSRQQLEQISLQLAETYAAEYALMAEKDLNTPAQIASLLQQTFDNFTAVPEEYRRDFLSAHLRHILAENPFLLGSWSILEPASIDNRDSLYINQIGSTILGNFRYIYYYENGVIMLSDYVEQDPDEVLSGRIYNLVKTRGKQTVVEPYYYSYSGIEGEEVLQTNIVSPVMHQSRFMGVVGVDISLEGLESMIARLSPVEGSFAFLLSHTGKLVTFPDPGLTGKVLEDTDLEPDNIISFNESIQQGQALAFNARYKQENYYIKLVPIPIGETETPWFLALAFPRKVILQEANTTLIISILTGVLGIALLAFVVLFIANNITRPLKKLTRTIQEISYGNVDNSMKLDIHTKDEIAQMAEAINVYIDGYAEKSHFANKIGEGDLDSELKKLSEKDHLAGSLLHMRDSLRNARKEEEIRREEDERRKWTNEGLNRFADILRQNYNSLEELASAVNRNLVEYLVANQAAIFIENDETEKKYELVAAYAYQRKKYMQASVLPGEGLVGSCAIEGKTVYLTQIPPNYIKITSGLGDANPDSLLLVPLKKEETVVGVIEIASFKKFLPYQIEFVEKIAENLASTVQAIQINMETSALLQKSQEQSEEMRAQEEEMRQNMEELQATQETMAMKESESQARIDELEKEIRELKKKTGKE